MKRLKNSGTGTGKARKALKNINKHIKRGCLSGVPKSAGTTKNERLHRSFNKNGLMKQNLISAQLGD